MTCHLSQLSELPGFAWHCPPPSWGFNHEGLFIEPAATDSWQRTHYGFSVDSGHFLLKPVVEDFVVSTTVRLHPHHQHN